MTTPSTDTVRSLLDAAAGDASALVSVDGETIGHRRLADEVDRLAEALRSFGIGPGDRVAVVLPNGPELALTLLAVMSVACAAPLNVRYKAEELAFYLGDLKPAALLTSGGVTLAVPAEAGDPLPVEVTGSGLSIDFAATPRAPRAVSASPAGDDPALVLHTSGTTSRPKMVPLRQRQLAASARNIARFLQLEASDRSLNVMPLIHIHGIMAGMLAPLSAGGSVVPTPGFDAFAFGRWLDELRPTYYSAVPTIHHLVLARTKPRPTSLRFVRSSSSKLPRGTFDQLGRLFGVPVIECYGMTEACHQMAANPLPPGEVKPGSVGLPAGIEIGVLADGSVAGRGTGEVVIRGATVIDGYADNPQADESAFFDGWFRTGDEGLLDEDGYLFLTGRIKEQINRGGEKISPLEVEEVLLEHPGVDEAAVFAVPDERLGEEVAAVVVPGGSPRPTDADLRAYLSGRLAGFKVPRTILFVDEIPKGPTGKVQRVGMAERIGIATS